MNSELGQYFTTDLQLQKVLVAFCKNAAHGKDRIKRPDPKRVILEPSAGRGDVVAAMHAAFPHCVTHSVEIDTSLPPAYMRKPDVWICADFLKTDLPRSSYRTIVGNPPYVRAKGKNLYLLFIEKCLSILSPGGEMVFVLPSDFFRLTSAGKILEAMVAKGAFTDIYRPNNDRLFKGATVDVMVIRYEKTKKLPQECRDYETGAILPYSLTGGVLTMRSDPDTSDSVSRLDTIASVHVGLVTGYERAFLNDVHGNIEVLVRQGLSRRYVLPSGPLDPLVKTALEPHKDALIARKIRRFDHHNWYEWGALRNIRLMEGRKGDPCVYLTSLTRSLTPAFIGKIGYFGHGLLCIVPKPNQSIDLDKLVSYLNSERFRESRTQSGRFRIGQRELSVAEVPNDISIMSPE